VLEKYPDGNKTADAMYLKGKALYSTDRKAAGRQGSERCGGEVSEYGIGPQITELLRTLASAPPPTNKKRKQ